MRGDARKKNNKENVQLTKTEYAKGLTARVSSRPGTKAALRRPRPAGTRQYCGFDTGDWGQDTLQRVQ